MPAVLACGAVRAETDQETPEPAPVHWSLGGGFVAVPNLYEGAGTTYLPVPAVRFSRGRFHVEGLTAGFRWHEKGPVQLDLFLAPRFLGFEEDDSDALEGLEDRKLSADLGGRATWRSRRLEVELSATRDILGRSRGETAGLTLRVPVNVGKWRLVPGAGPQWWSADFVDYYVGVRPHEARPGRPAYEGRSTVHWGGELTAIRRIGARWSFIGNATVRRLGREVRDSPIVGRSVSQSGFAGFLYTF